MSKFFKGYLGTKWILGNNLEFLKEESKDIFGNKGDFGNFSREHGNTDPLGGSFVFITTCTSDLFLRKYDNSLKAQLTPF